MKLVLSRLFAQLSRMAYVADLSEIGARNLARIPENERRQDGSDWRIECPEGGSDHLVFNPAGNSFKDFADHDWSAVARGLLRSGILPTYYSIEYVYADALGKPLFAHGKRRDLRDYSETRDWTQGIKRGKNGVPFRTKGKGALKGIPRVLYDLPLVRENPKVWLCAGEKDAEVARYSWGVNATTRPFGEGHWDEAYFAQLDHATAITIVIDNDDAGYRGGWTVYSKVRTKLKAEQVRCVRPVDEAKDLFEHIHRGYTRKQLIPVPVDELKERGAKPKKSDSKESGGDPHTVDVTNETEGSKQLQSAVNLRLLPGVYQRYGKPVEVTVNGEDQIVYVTELDVPSLRRLCRELNVIKYVSDGSGGTKSVTTLPTETLCRLVLSSYDWKLFILRHIIESPIMRSDGTILQSPGYDELSRFYLHLNSSYASVPDEPTAEEVQRYRSFLFDELLHDFPWRSSTDLANYVAMLFTPVIREYIGALYPMFVLDAPMAGSGKTLAADIIGCLYGSQSYAWTNSDEELEKRISTILRSTEDPVVVWDNVGSRDSLYQPSIAKLLTSSRWSGRVLGKSEGVTLVNDRIWIATGRNITLDGDMFSRTVRTRIETGPNPEKRKDFVLGDLTEWLKNPVNVSKLRTALLTLARAWILSGAPVRTDLRMRQFSRWASVCGGVLDFLEVPGFLTVINDEEQTSEEEQEMEAFLAKWFTLSTPPLTVRQIIDHKDRFGDTYPEWIEQYKGDPAKRLGKHFARNAGKWIGTYRLTGRMDRSSRKLWSVEQQTELETSSKPA